MPEPSGVIRAARESELPLISALEKSGEGLYRAAGMDRVADAPAPEPDCYRPALEDGRLLVAVDEGDTPVGFIRLRSTASPTSSRSAFTLTMQAGASERRCLLRLSNWPALADIAG